MKNQTFERIDKHLHKRRFQAESGKWNTYYYAVFVDWKKKRRIFPLGPNLKLARIKLGELEADNFKRKDFDQEKIDLERAKTQGITLLTWLGRYLELVKSKRSWSRDEQHCKHLTRVLGEIPLSLINRPRIMEYKNQRIGESIQRYGKPVKGTLVKVSTINREIRCLLHALNLAADEGLIETVPRIRLESEQHLQRDRVLSDKEYRVLLEASPKWLRRVVIGAYESCLSRADLLKLTWDSVEDGLIKVRGGRAKTGVRQRVGISPALREVLDELKAEQTKLPNTEGRVFTQDGKPITVNVLRSAFDKAVQRAEVKDFHFHDLKHCGKTKWAAMGLPGDISDVGSGHAIPGMRGRYTNLRDQDIRESFKKMFMRCLEPDSVGSEVTAK